MQSTNGETGSELEWTVTDLVRRHKFAGDRGGRRVSGTPEFYLTCDRDSGQLRKVKTDETIEEVSLFPHLIGNMYVGS